MLIKILNSSSDCWTSQCLCKVFIFHVHLHQQRNIETCTLPYVKQRASGNSLCDAGSSDPELCHQLEEWDREGGGWEVQEGGNICIPVADSC